MFTASGNFLYNAIRLMLSAKWIDSDKVMRGIPNDLKRPGKYVRNENYSNFPGRGKAQRGREEKRETEKSSATEAATEPSFLIYARAFRP